MTKIISNISLLVNDYDEAIDFYVNKLGFALLCDVPVTNEQRWVRISAVKNAANNTALVLCKASVEQRNLVGKQAGDGVFLFLQTDDFWTDYHKMQVAGVEFLESQPREEVYATVIVFFDLYGNKWDLLQPKIL
ncbi:MAG: catechol 2,3-dioxygenase-like lactoylglutathione lyase family enzyme [Paraglaciecola sp.]|jgi:catechol 2,3-dioxygenase-like lactoylglutathione lyase family enzyme